MATSDEQTLALLEGGHSKITQTAPAFLDSIAERPRPSTARHRPGYARVPSVSFVEEHQTSPELEVDSTRQTNASPSTVEHGLGIEIVGAPQHSIHKAKRVSLQSVRSTPIVAKPPSGAQDSADASTPFMSLPSTGGLSGSTRFDDDQDISYDAAKNASKQSVTSLNSLQAPSTAGKSDAGAYSVQSNQEEFEAYHQFRAQRNIKHGLGTWVSVTILTLAIFSTIFSS